MKYAFFTNVPYPNLAIDVACCKHVFVVWTKRHVSHRHFLFKLLGLSRWFLSDVPQKYVLIHGTTDEEIRVEVGPGNS